jgi:hypothetical protein
MGLQAVEYVPVWLVFGRQPLYSPDVPFGEPDSLARKAISISWVVPAQTKPINSAQLIIDQEKSTRRMIRHELSGRVIPGHEILVWIAFAQVPVIDAHVEEVDRIGDLFGVQRKTISHVDAPERLGGRGLVGFVFHANVSG